MFVSENLSRAYGSAAFGDPLLDNVEEYNGILGGQFVGSGSANTAVGPGINAILRKRLASIIQAGVGLFEFIKSFKKISI